MGTVDETITTIQAAFRPDADVATKQQAAGLLRSLLAVLEATPGMPLTTPAAPTPTPAPAASPPQPDMLGILLEKFRVLLPSNAANAELSMPRLNIPLVGVPKR